MRHRKASPSVLTDVSEGGPSIDTSESHENITCFQAEHTEKSAMAFLNVMSVVLILLVPLIGLHYLFTGLSMRATLLNLPLWLPWGVLCGYKRFWQKLMKSHPVTVASAVQCAGHSILVCSMVWNPLSMPQGLAQHRVFLTGFLPVYMLTASNLYIPMPLFLSFVCPLYFVGWLAFHISVGYITVLSMVWPLSLLATGVYIQNYQSCILQREFNTKCTLDKERHLLQASRKSFQGILSSIFDASCTCDCNGQLHEFSPQLQALLELPVSAEDPGTQENTAAPNLCLLAATDAEGARLEVFLAATCSCAFDQASKIHCSFRRGLCEEVVDICMYAIVLEDYSHGQDAQDLLYVVLEAIPTAQNDIPEEEHIAVPVEASGLAASNQFAPEPSLLSCMEESVPLAGGLVLGGEQSSGSSQVSVDSQSILPGSSKVFSQGHLDDILDMGLVEHWLLPDTWVVPNYEKVLGEGGQSIVYGGAVCGSSVAIKRPKRSSTRPGQIDLDLAKELRILRRVRHPNIVLFHGAWMTEGSLAVVLEHVKGQSLLEFVFGRELPRSYQHPLMNGISSALWYLNLQQPHPIVHGDLKPGNIMVEIRVPVVDSRIEPNAKLIDFGLSRVLSPNTKPLGGTVHWSAPEILVGGAPTVEADIFSFGRVMFFVMTGKKPYELNKEETLLYLDTHGSLPALPWPTSGLDPFETGLVALCNRCVSLEKAARPTWTKISLGLNRSQ